ncbi:hypothetical protein [Phenylobacterium sp.]|uniref:hypothetical protein n=1 Tax=Phenylobacterium sp. TaxID=1871053 RepID=UPI0035ADB1DE
MRESGNATAVSAGLQAGDYKAVSTLYNALMTGLVLTLVSQRGAADAADFVVAHFRHQHLEKFLPGLKKLGLDGLPHAVACAQYHYFSNALGGVKTEYIPESDKKAWVRYPPPRWIWQGTAICGVPRQVNEAMLHGWHGHNGVSLGNPRLGFVCTGQTVLGDPGLEGYYFEYDHELSSAERVRFAPDERCPPLDPAAQPRLDSASWPAERRMRVERSYAAEYVRTLMPVMRALFPAEAAQALIGRAGRLIGLQFRDEAARLTGVEGRDARAFARMLHRLALAHGETAELDEGSATVTQTGWRLMDGVAVDPDWAFAAWKPLWEGMCAAHDRFLSLDSEFRGDAIVWRVRS